MWCGVVWSGEGYNFIDFPCEVTTMVILCLYDLKREALEEIEVRRKVDYGAKQWLQPLLQL